MPITQDRMLAVLNAAESLISSFKILISALQNRRGAHDPTVASIMRKINTNGEFTMHDINALIEAHDALIDLVVALQPNFAAIDVIAREIGHFNSTRKRNDKTREAQARRRLRNRTEIEIRAANAEVDELFNFNPSDEPELTIDDFKNRILATGVPFLDTEAIQNLANCSESNFQAIMLPLLDTGFLIYDPDNRVFRVQVTSESPSGPETGVNEG